VFEGQTATVESQTLLEAAIDVHQPPSPVLHAREGLVPAVQDMQEHPTPFVQARQPPAPSVQVWQPTTTAVQKWQPPPLAVQEGQALPSIQAMNSGSSSSCG
jgi:hypothetical protein